MPKPFPTTVTLADAFRSILRVRHSSRPELAGEITSYHWFHYSMHKPQDEVSSAKEALTMLKEAVTGEKVRLRGAQVLAQPLQDIDPADARTGELDIFAGKLEVSHNGKVVRKYEQVHCYSGDISRLAKLALVHKKPASEAELDKVVTQHFDGGGAPIEKAVTAAVKAAGLKVTRSRIRDALRRRGPRSRGRPKKTPE